MPRTPPKSGAQQRGTQRVRRPPLMMALEPRVMFDGAAAPTAHVLHPWHPPQHEGSLAGSEFAPRIADPARPAPYVERITEPARPSEAPRATEAPAARPAPYVERITEPARPSEAPRATEAPAARPATVEPATVVPHVHDLLSNTTTTVATAAQLNAAITADDLDLTGNDTITLTGNITYAAATDAAVITHPGTGTLTINGAGYTINAAYLGRVLTVTAGNVVVENITLEHGLLAGAGGALSLSGVSELGAGIYNSGTLTLMNVNVTQNVATAGGGGGTGAVGAGGGGGSGAGGIGGAAGGGVGASLGSGSTGGKGAGSGGGLGGSASGGGAGGTPALGGSAGGMGATTTSAGLTAGGGGGGSGYVAGNGAAGGNAAGGIYNAGTGKLYVLGSSAITNNLGAAGGGGGGIGVSLVGGINVPFHGGAGGQGVGGIWNATTGQVYITAAAYSAMTGNVGADGTIGSAGPVSSGGSNTGITTPAAAAKINSGSGTVTKTYVPTTPVVSSIATVGSSPNNAASDSFTVNFSEAVTGVNALDFSPAIAGTVAGVITSVTGSGSTYTVVVGPVTGDGTLGLNFNPTTPVYDAAGNLVSSSYSGGQTYTIEHTPPVATAITGPASNPNNLATDTFTVNFSEAVGGVSASDFTLATTGTVAAGITSVAAVSPDANGRSTSYTVTVGGSGGVGSVTGNGTLELNLNTTGASITDAAGNALVVGTLGSVYGIEHTAPVVTSINTVGSTTNNASSEAFVVTFSEAVSTPLSTDFTLTNTGTSAGVITSITPVTSSAGTGGYSSYTVLVSPVTGDGTMRMNFYPLPSPVDAAGNVVAASFTSGQTYTIEHTPPVATSIATVGANPNAAATDQYTVTFSEAVGGVSASDFTLATTGTVAAGITTVAAVSPDANGRSTSYTVTVGGSGGVGSVTGNGTLQLNLNATGTGISDAAGNAIVGGAVGQVYGIEHTAPVVTSINTVGSTTNNASSEAFVVTFSEAVSTPLSTDFTLTNTGTSAGVITSITPVTSSAGTGGYSSYTVLVSPVTGDGTMRMNFYPLPSPVDAAGNVVAASFTSGQTYTIEHTPPVATSITGPASNPNNLATDTFTVNFSEAVGGVSASDFTLATTGTVAAGITSVAAVSPDANGRSTSYTVTVGGSGGVGSVTGNGTLELNLNTTGASITDAAGNALVVGTLGSVYGIEHTAPVVTSINTVGSTTNNASSEAFVVTFSEAVSTPLSTDFTLTNTGTSAGVITSITPVTSSAGTGGYSSYTVLVSPVTGDGTMRMNFYPLPSPVDAAGNVVAASFTSGQTYTIEHTPPVATSIATVGANPNAAATDQYTVTFSEAVGGVTASDFTLATTGTVAAGITTVAAVSPDANGRSTSYTVTVGGTGGVGSVTGNGTLQLNLNATGTGISDAAGNAIVGGALGEVYAVSHTQPTVTAIATVGATTNNATSDTFTVTFSEPVSGVTAADFTVATTGTVLGAITSLTAVNPVNGLASSYTVIVGPVAGTGTLGLDFVSPLVGQPVDAYGNVTSGSFTGSLYTVNQTPPVALSISAAAGDSSSSTSDQFTVTFSEPVTGVATSNFSLAATGSATGTIGAVTPVNPVNGAASSYTVTVDGIHGSGSIEVNLSSGTGITDVAGNALIGGAVGPLYAVSVTAPSVTSITLVDAATNNGTTEAFTVNFSENVGGVAAGDFVLTDGGGVTGTIGTVTAVSPDMNGRASSYTVTVNNVTGNGTMRLDLSTTESGISDASGNAVSGGYSGGATYTINHTAPSVTSIALLDAATNNGTTEQFTVNFSENVGGLAASDFVLTDTGGVTGTISAVTAVSPDANGRASSYTVTVSSVAGNGTLRLDLSTSQSGISDAAGNSLSGGYTGGPSYTINQTAPTVSSIALVDAGTNNLTSEQFTVNFSEAVSGAQAGDFVLTDGGTVTGTIGAVTAVSPDANGRASSYTVTVNNVTGNGTMRLDLSTLEAGITDAAGNTVSGGYTTGPSYTIEHTPPVATSITGPASNPNNLATDTFTVNFSEAVGGVTASDFTLLTTGTVAAGITSVAAVSPDANGRSTSYTVTVGGSGGVGSVTGNGTLELNLNATGTGISDAAGNAIVGGAVGQVYGIEHTAPVVTSINTVGSTTNNASSEAFVVTFSEAVSTPLSTDFTLTNTGTSAGVITSITPVTSSAGTGGYSSYTVLVSPATGDGTMRMNFYPLPSPVDAAGNVVAASFTSGQTYTIEHTPPVTTSIATTGANPNHASSDNYTVTFSENVSGVVASDFALLTTGSVAGSITSVTPVNPDANGRANTYTVTVAGVTGNGTLELNLNGTGTGISDAAGNALAVGTVGQTYVIEQTPPVATAITGPASNPNNLATDTFTVTFSEAVGGVTASDFTLLTTGTVAAGITSVAAVSPDANGRSTSYTVTVGGSGGVGSVTGNGTLELNLNATGTGISDAAGNAIVGGAVGQVYGIEHTAPVVTSINTVGSTTNNASSEAFVVTFSEAVSTPLSTDFTLTNTGTSAGVITSITPVTSSAGTGGYSSYTVLVSPVTGDGTMRMNFYPLPSPVDAAGNVVAASFTSGQTYTIEHTPPVATSIVAASGDSPSASSEQFTVNLSENVGGVVAGDFTLVNTGTVGGAIASVTPVNPDANGRASAYTVTVNGVTGIGTLQVNLNATGTGITDAAGNAILGGALGPAYGITHTLPTVSSIVLDDPATNNLTTEQYTVNFSENVTGVNAADFSLANTGTVGGVITSVTGSGSSYTVTVSPVVGDGTMRLNLNALTTIVDATGNTTAGGYTSGPSYTIEHTPPVATSIDTVGTNPNAAATDQYTVTFSEAVGGVSASDFTLATTGTVAAGITTVAAVSPDANGRSTSYTVTVGGSGGVGSVTGNGTLQLNLNATGTGISDAAGNAIVGGALGEVYAVSHTQPTVTSIATVGATTNNATSDTFTVTFSEPVSGVTAADFTVATTGTVLGAITSLTAVNPVNGLASSYTVIVGPVAGTGTLGLDFVSPLVGQPVDAYGNVTSGSFTGSLYTVNQTPPVALSISAAAGDSSSSTSDQFTVTFSEPVTGVATSNFSLAATGSATGTIGAVTPVNPVNGAASSYTVTVDGIHGSGSIEVNLSSGTGITDVAGNALIGGAVGPLYAVSVTAPSVTSITLVDAATNNGTTEAFTVNFSENVGGVAAGDFVLTDGGGVTGTIGTVTAVSPDMNGRASSYTVTVSNVTGNGTMRLDLSTTESGISDAGGNAVSGGYSGGATYTINHTAPSVTSIALLDAATNNGTTEQFTVNFSENVGGLAASDFVLTDTGGVTGTISAVTAVSPDANGRASSYTVTVSSVAGNGTLRLDLSTSQSGISDAAGNSLSGGYTGGPSYTINQTAPTVSSIALVDAGTNNLTSEQFTVNFSEAVSGAQAGDFVLTDGGTVTGTIGAVTAVSPDANGRASSYTVTVNNVTGNGTMRLDLSTLEAGITDAAGNTVSGGYTTGPTYTIEHTPPTVSSVTAVNVGPSNSSTQVFVVDFSEGVTGVTAADFTAATTGTVAAGSITVTPASPYSNSYTVTVNGVTGNGTLGLNVNASGTGIADAAGNAILGGFNTGASITIANAPPAVTSIALVDATTNNLGTEQFTVTFSESVSGVTAGDFMLTNGGTVVGTIASVVAVNADVLGHATTYTVTVDNVTGDGTMRLDLAATESGITDYAGNMASGGYIAGPTYSIEHTPPAVTSIALVDPATNNASSEQFTVNFSEAVSGVDAGDFALTNGGTVSGSITAVAAVNPDANGRASAYTVTVSNVTGDGTMKLNLSAAQAGIEDAAGNAASGGFTSGPTYTIEHTAPVVSSINLVDAATNNLASEQFTVTFSASVAGVTAGDFVLTDSSGLAGTIGGVSAVNPDASGRASTYTVTVNDVTGDGTMRLDLNAAQSGISDAAGNTVSGGYTVGPSYTVQQTAPAVTSIALVDAATNNAATEQFTVNFSENVGGVTAGDFVLTTGGSVTGTIGTITAVNPGADGRASAYTVTVTNVTGDGTLRLDVSAAQSGITDAAGNAATGAYTAGPAYTLEHTAPVVASIGLVGSASNDNASEQFTVSFSENVGGVDAGDFVLSNGGTVSGAITGVVAVDPDANGRASVYTVTVSGVSGVGTMRLDLGNSTAGITDAAGNTLTGGYDTGPSYTLGTAVPAVESIAVVGPTTSNATSEQFTVQFSEDVSGVGVGDFVLTTTGTVAGTVAAVTGSGDTYTVTVDDVSGDGTLRLDLNGTGPGIVDGAAHPLQTGFTGGQVVTLEQTPPSVTAITAVGSSPNNAATEQYTVTFSQNVSGVTAADFALVNSGSVAGTISSVTGSGDTYTVTVSNVTGNGTMRLDVNAGTDIVDAAGNPLAGGYTGAVITLEHAAPTVTSFVPVGSSPNDAASEQYTITFSENVSGVDLGDFTLLHTGTAAGKITAVTGSGNSYIVTLSDVSGDGTLQLALNASASGITDAAGNPLGGGAGGSGSLSEPPITVEHTPPAVTSIDTVGANPNDAGSERYTVTFSENVSGVTAGDFSLATTGTASGKITSVSGSGNTYVVTVSEVTGEGTMRLDLDASATGIRDAAGNPISAGFTAGETFTVQHSAPVVESVSAPPSNTYMAGETFEFTVTYDEPVVVDTAGGRPSIPVNLQSGGTHNATYVGGSGTDTLTFEYTVGPSDQSPNGITLGTAIALNGATLADAAGNAGSLTLANVASDRGVIVGGVPPQLPLPGQGVGSSGAGSGAAAAGGASTPTVYAGYVDNNLYTSNELATARYVPLMAEIDPLASSTQPVLTDVGDIVIDQSVQPPLAVAALLEPVNTSFAFSVPIGTFQFDPGAVVAVTARLVDGSALPQWLAFDPSTGRFEGSAPKGWSEHLHIIVSARDQNGRDVMLPVEVQFARPGDAAPTARLVPRPHRAHASVRPGKDSLAVQFARYGRHARERELVTLANHG